MKEVLFYQLIKGLSWVLFMIIINMVLSGCQESGDVRESGDYRNVIFIIGDDHTKSALSMNNHKLVKTPNLDRLASQGVSFSRAYCNSPICSPSRQSMLTGKYPHATGVTLLFTPFQDSRNETIAEHLSKNSFKTALVGKSHFNEWIWGPLYADTSPDFGFQTIIDRRDYRDHILEFQPTPIPDSIATMKLYTERNPESIWNTRFLPGDCYEKDCSGTYLTQRAIDFLEENKDNRFLLWMAYHEPHQPFDFPVEYRNNIDPEQIVLPEGSPEDDRWVPELFKQFEPDQVKNAVSAYLTSVEYMDNNIGKILTALENLGLDENTLIVYTSDNGYLLYDHKRLEKHTMWEQAVSVPLIIKGREILAEQNDQLISNIDLAPTVLNALGVPPLPEAQGRSFYPMLRKENHEPREFVFSEYLEDNMAMITTRKWKYIFMTGKRDLGLEYATGFGAPGITHLLYDLENDPGEAANVSGSDDNKEVLGVLQEKMLQEFMATHPDAVNAPTELSLIGKLVWFCEPRDVGAEHGGVPLRISG
ncbi:MAG: sulfatase-like hydrolase/transferase [Bacteroidetes bacterium]|nr:sulfatase-like hydrolase/transferase [Bacteroidota bacterium]MDA1120514.1 sulfatase-like hydrolase/transferase [Bacteroidota bacterium]